MILNTLLLAIAPVVTPLHAADEYPVRAELLEQIGEFV